MDDDTARESAAGSVCPNRVAEPCHLAGRARPSLRHPGTLGRLGTGDGSEAA